MSEATFYWLAPYLPQHFVKHITEKYFKKDL